MHRLGIGRLMLVLGAISLIVALWPVVRGGSLNPVFLGVSVAFAVLGLVIIKTR